jgi:hypothetical protein
MSTFKTAFNFYVLKLQFWGEVNGEILKNKQTLNYDDDNDGKRAPQKRPWTPRVEVEV